MPAKTQSLPKKAEEETCSECSALTVGSGFRLRVLDREGKLHAPRSKNQGQQSPRLCVRPHHWASPSRTEVSKSPRARTQVGNPRIGSGAFFPHQPPIVSDIGATPGCRQHGWGCFLLQG